MRAGHRRSAVVGLPSLLARVRRLAAAAALVLTPVLLPAPGSAQTTDDSLRSLRTDVEALKAGQVQIQKDLAEIKELLKARGAGPPPALANIALTLDGDPVKGDRAAKVVLFDFTDYQ